MEGNRWACNGAIFLHPPMPCKGTLDGCFGVTVWVLSWIYQSGECFMSFAPPSAAPCTIHSLPLFSFQVTQSLRCTQGVVITGAAEIGQDKGTLPTQDVFPSFF